MNKEDKIVLLERLQEELLGYKIPCVLRKPEEDPKVSIPILTTLHRNMGRGCEEVMGEYYFQQILAGTEEGYYFTLMISISEELNEETYGMFSVASSILNFYLPFGAFVLNREIKTFAFKHTVVIPASISAEQAYEMINQAIGGSLDIIDNNIDILEDMEKGEATLEDFLETMSLTEEE